MSRTAQSWDMTQSMSPRSKLMAAQAKERRKGCGQAPTRVELMLGWAAEAEQKKIAMRAQREAEEVEGCTFKPQLRRPRSAPRVTSSGTSVFTPACSTAAVSSRPARSGSASPPPAAVPRVGAAQAHDVLYARAESQRRVHGERIAQMENWREELELAPCTFKPDTVRSAQSYRRTRATATSARFSSTSYPRGFNESRQRLRTAAATRNEALQMHAERLGRLRPVDAEPSANMSTIGMVLTAKKPSTSPEGAFEKIRSAQLQADAMPAKGDEPRRRSLPPPPIQSMPCSQESKRHADGSHDSSWQAVNQAAPGITSQTHFHEWRDSNMYSAVDEAVAIASVVDATPIPEGHLDELGHLGSSASYLQLWRCEPSNGFKLGVRCSPTIDGPMTSEVVQPGDVFPVCQELKGGDGVLYLQMAVGARGWVFDHKPGVGTMCVRHEPIASVDLNASFADAAAPEPSRGSVASDAQVVRAIVEDDMPASSPRQTLLNLEVRVRVGEPAVALVFREGDNVAEVAAEFATRHALPDNVAEKFYNLLEQQLVLLQQRE